MSCHTRGALFCLSGRLTFLKRRWGSLGGRQIILPTRHGTSSFQKLLTLFIGNTMGFSLSFYNIKRRLRNPWLRKHKVGMHIFKELLILKAQKRVREQGKGAWAIARYTDQVKYNLDFILLLTLLHVALQLVEVVNFCPLNSSQWTRNQLISC